MFARLRRSFLLPLALLLAGLMMAVPAVRGQADDITMTYWTYPGQDFNDVVARLDTNAAVVRRLNKDKIGPNGELKPYTPLRIPTTPENRGVNQGAYPPPKAAKAAGAQTAQTAQAAKPAAPLATKPAAPAPTAAPTPAPAATPAAPTYDTRPAPITYDAKNAPSLWTVLARFVGATVVMLALIYGFLHLVKRFGWEGPLSRWAKPLEPRGGAPAASPGGRRFGWGRRAAPPASETPPTAEPSPAAAPVSGFAEHLRAARAEAPPADRTDEKTERDTLLGPVSKANTYTGFASEPAAGPVARAGVDDARRRPEEADESDPDDDEIPETSLEDALRGRRRRG